MRPGVLYSRTHPTREWTAPGRTPLFGGTNETRDPLLWPFSAESIWNTPIGDGIEVGSLSHPMAVGVRATKGAFNHATYSTPVNVGNPGDPSLTIRPVPAGQWSPKSSGYPDVLVPHAPASLKLGGEITPPTFEVRYASSGAVTFYDNSRGATFQPDAFMAIIDRETLTAYESYKTFWNAHSTTNLTPNPGGRMLVAREGSINSYSLLGDGWTQRLSRASWLGFLTGLIRKWEIEKATGTGAYAGQAPDPFAIRHALCLALPLTSLLRPSQDTGTHPAKTTAGYQWPARGRDSHAESSPGYTGSVRMGTHFVLNPSFNIASAGLSDIGLALAYCLRDYGAYVCDASQYTSIYGEEGMSAAAGSPADRLRLDWQNPLLPNMVPVLNNSPANPGGPGSRVRPLAPPFAIA